MVMMGAPYENYSKKLYGFLTMKGFRYDRSFKHRETGKTCWVYIMTPELSAALREWAAQKPTK